MRARGEVCKRNIKLNNLRKMELDALQFWNSRRVNGRRFKFWEGDDSEDIVGIILSRRVSSASLAFWAMLLYLALAFASLITCILLFFFAICPLLCSSFACANYDRVFPPFFSSPRTCP